MYMPRQEGFEESLKAVYDAEKAVYEAQSNPNGEEQQEAFMQLRKARDKVTAVQMQLDGENKEGHHRLHQALEQLHHLEEAEQALED